MRITSTPKSTRTLKAVDQPTQASGGAIELWNPAVRIDAALAAFDRIVSQIDGVTVYGQALVVDGRVLIDLAESDENLIAA